MLQLDEAYLHRLRCEQQSNNRQEQQMLCGDLDPVLLGAASPSLASFHVAGCSTGCPRDVKALFTWLRPSFRPRTAAARRHSTTRMLYCRGAASALAERVSELATTKVTPCGRGTSSVYRCCSTTKACQGRLVIAQVHSAVLPLRNSFSGTAQHRRGHGWCDALRRRASSVHECFKTGVGCHACMQTCVSVSTGILR